MTKTLFLFDTCEGSCFFFEKEGNYSHSKFFDKHLDCILRQVREDKFYDLSQDEDYKEIEWKYST